MSRRSARAFAFVLAGSWLWAAGSARGEDAAARVVDVVLVGALARDDALGRRITSWFDPEQFRVTIDRAAVVDAKRVLSPDREDAIFAWVTLENGQLAHLYFVTVRGQEAAYLLRDLVLENGVDELGAERIAQVVYSSIQAVAAGRGQNRREDLERSLATKQPAAPAAPAAPEPSSSRVEAGHRRARFPTWGIGYGASFRGVEGLWHGPRASASIELDGGFGARVAATAAFPTEHDFGVATLGFYGASFYAAPSFRHPVGDKIELEWSAGLGLDLVHYVPSAAAANVVAGSSGTDARPGIAAEVRAVVAGGRAAFVLRCSVDFSRTHYDVVRDGERQVLGRPWPVAPGIAFELSP